MKFSIIVPVYNVERYLDECLQSIQVQYYKDYEVLLINDGSTDKSGVICDRYAERDNRFQVFHQENKGVSAARNVGIENAKGEWLCFIDSDDLIEPTYLHKFSENISADADMVIQGIKRIGKVNDVLCSFKNEDKITKEAFFDHYKIWPHYFSPCNKAFRITIIRKYNLKFNESIHYGEDTIFNLDYATHANGLFTLLPDINYIYRFNFEGLCTTVVGFYNHEYLFRYVKDNLKKFTDKRDELYWYCTPALEMLYLDKSVGRTYEPLKLFLKNHKREVLEIFDGDKASMKIITYLIKKNQYLALDWIFKSIYKKRIEL